MTKKKQAKKRPRPKKDEFVEPLIRFEFFGYNPILTVDEFDQLEREVTARCIADDTGIAEQILARLIENNRYRANECRAALLAHRKTEALANHLLVDASKLAIIDSDHKKAEHRFQAFEARWSVIGTNSPFTFKLL